MKQDETGEKYINTNILWLKAEVLGISELIFSDLVSTALKSSTVLYEQTNKKKKLRAARKQGGVH